MAFIDIHSHYAWNVDDGIETREDAQAAVHNALGHGVALGSGKL